VNSFMLFTMLLGTFMAGAAVVWFFVESVWTKETERLTLMIESRDFQLIVMTEYSELLERGVDSATGTHAKKHLNEMCDIWEETYDGK